MARPKDADSGATYDRIVHAATQLIGEHGVAALSMRQVAERSEQSLGAITYYFENRSGLLEACLEKNYEWIAERVSQSLKRIAGGGAWADEVDGFVRQLFRATRNNQELIRSRLVTTMQAGALPGGRLEQQLLPALDKIAAVLGGSKAVVDLRLAAHTLELIVTRYGLHTDAECTSIVGIDDIDEAVQRMEDHLVRLCTASFTDAIKLP